MKATAAMLACVTSLVVLAAIPGSSQEVQQNALLAPSAVPTMLDDAATENTPDTRQYAEGKQAISEGRWADAVTIFSEVAKQGGARADSALYWEAYALNKAGRSDDAIRTCADLQTAFRKSTWNEDCGALQIEINASRGKPQAPKPQESDELKLLALASLMQKDPTEATAQIRELVQGDASERLKEGAVFILGQQVPEATYPEIVRISYLEGDVRVARASENQNIDKTVWNDAIMNLPISEGDSIATGKDGRVEIEFEDASTVYVAENSVLNFIDLHTTAGVPHSELALVSGTMTTHLDSLIGGETYLIRTPTENLLTHYPQKSDLRITSYLDGMAVTPMGDGALNVTGSDRVSLTAGKTVYFGDAHHLSTAEEAANAANYSSFDAWVADRYAGRTATLEAMMKDSGLKKPIPGLADMSGKGHFFPCPPYGTCWQPDAPQTKAMLAAPPTPPPTPKTARPSAGGPAAGAPQSPMMAAAWFPCMDSWYGGAWGYSGAAYVDPYSWAVCHAGGWIPYDNGYAWVATSRRFHHCPVRWVRFGHRVAAVPLNPRDTKGKPPVNGRGYIAVKGKQGIRLEPVKFDGKPPETIKTAPREFRNVPKLNLAHVEAPRMEAHALHENFKAGIPATRSLPMNFNLKQGFTTPRQVGQGGSAKTVNFPVGRPGSGVWGSGFAGRGSVGFGAISARVGGFSGSRGGNGGNYSGSSGFNNGSFGGASSGFSGGSVSSGSVGGGSVGGGGPVSAPPASGGPVAAPK